jgi:hypothetical protein
MERLFSRISSFDVIRENQKEIKEEVTRMGERALNDPATIDKLISKYSLDVPTIVDSDIYQKKPFSTTREVSARSDYSFMYDSTTAQVTRFTFMIPFKGNHHCFDVQPSTYSMSPPFGVIVGNEIKIETDVFSGDNAQNALTSHNNNLNQIKQHLETLRKDFATYNSTLKSHIESQVESKRNKINKDIDTANSFGIPIK